MIEMILSVDSLWGSGVGLYPPLLAQLILGTSSQAVFLGLIIAGSGAGLYFLRSFRPELARDHDIFFAAIGLLCGGITMINGWRLDPILMFSQIMLGGSAIFFATESIRLRGITTDQARRNTPIVDDERPVGRVYRAELDELSPSEDEPPLRRIRSARDSDAREESAYGDRYSSESRYDSGERPRRSRGRRSRSSSRASEDFDRDEPRRPRRRSSASRSDSEYDSYDNYGRETSSRRRSSQSSSVDAERRRRSTVASMEDEPRSSRRRRSARSSVSETRSQRDDYVDYRPVDYSDNSPRSYDGPSEDEWA